MNDFTKEELERLLSDHWSCGGNDSGLYEKIQSLIDNYCEHEETSSDHNYDVERCKKCGELTL